MPSSVPLFRVLAGVILMTIFMSPGTAPASSRAAMTGPVTKPDVCPTIVVDGHLQCHNRI